MEQLMFELAIVMIGLFIYRYEIKFKRLINTISIFVIIVLLSRQAMSMTPYGYIIYKLGVMGLGVAYWNRFKEKSARKTMDHIKCGILIMMALYPMNALFFRNGTESENAFFRVFTIVTIFLASASIFIDKWTLRKFGGV